MVVGVAIAAVAASDAVVADLIANARRSCRKIQALNGWSSRARRWKSSRAWPPELKIELNGEGDTTKDDLVNLILQARTERDGSLFLEGVLEIVDEGYGFLRRDAHWLPGKDDIYVSQSQVRRFSLRTGDLVSGQVRPARDGDRYHGLVRVVAVNSVDPEKARGVRISGA